MQEEKQLRHQIEIIAAIKANDSIALKPFYIANYRKTQSLVLSNSGTEEDAKDVYQDAFIVVWNSIKNNTFVPINETAIEGFLYSTSKNKWLDILKSSRFKKMRHSINEAILKNEANEESQDDSFELKMKSTMNAFKNLGEPCKALLTTFYFEKKSLKDIAQILNIEEATARNKKYRCMEKLRSLVIPQKNLHIERQ